MKIDPETGEVLQPTREDYDKLQEWRNAAAEVASVKPIIEKEMKLRKEVAALFFTQPKEGVNTVELNGGWTLKLSHKLDRKLDETVLDAVKSQLRELGFNADLLISYPPKLETAVYRTLDDEKRHIFDQALTIKPASPTLELKAPK